jgi:hypothetical protein
MRFRTHDSVSEQHRRRQARDEGTPPTKPQFNNGNSEYILTLPTGDYDLQDAGDDTVNIIQHREDGSSEFIVALPAGFDYSGKSDAAGFHIYAKQAGEADVRPLTGDVAPNALGYDYRSHARAIAAFNARQTQKHTGPEPRVLPGSPITKLANFVSDRSQPHRVDMLKDWHVMKGSR